MSAAEKKIKVWDGPVRLFHWTLLILFALSAYSAFQDKFGIYADIHLWSGVGVIALIVWRILWGLVGSETARFSNFVKSPRALFSYARERYHPGVGHNPIGGYSVLLLLSLLLVQAVLGLYSSDGMLFSGPLAGSDADDIQDIHEQLGYILFGIVGLHVAAILWYRIARKDDLVTPMVTGKKAIAAPAPKTGSPVLAAALLLVAAAGSYYLIF